jgi:hypothetical protein
MDRQKAPCTPKFQKLIVEAGMDHSDKYQFIGLLVVEYP